MDMITVALTIADVHDARREIINRIQQSAAAGLNHATSVTRTMPERLIQERAGVLGEIAVRRWSGLPNGPLLLNVFHTVPDVGSVEVRTATRHHYRLPFRSNDPMQRRYVFCTYEFPETAVRLHGWIWGYEVRPLGAWENPGGTRPVFFVPSNKLRPLAELSCKLNLTDPTTC